MVLVRVALSFVLSSPVVVVQVCVGETHSSTNCSFAQMVAAERAVIALSAPDGGLVSCFTFVNAPPTLLPFNQVLGIESHRRGIFRAAKPRWDKALVLWGDVQLTICKDEDVLVDVVYDY